MNKLGIFFLKTVQHGIGTRLRQGWTRNIHLRHALRARLLGGNPKTTGVAEGVEHRFSCGIRGDNTAALTLVQVVTRLVTRANIDLKLHIALLDDDALGRFDTCQEPLGLRQAFVRQTVHIASIIKTFGTSELHQQAHHDGFGPHGAGSGKLTREHLAVAIHGDAWQTISLCIHQAQRIGSETGAHLGTNGERGSEFFAEKGFIHGGITSKTPHAHTDLRGRRPRTHAQDLTRRGANLHGFANGRFAIHFGNRTRKDPRVTLTCGAIAFDL